jgi:hypothetical protein
VGATGQLQRLGSNPAFGWPLNSANTSYGIGHMHNYYWRLDFDVNGTATDDQVEEIEFTQSGSLEQFTRVLTPFTTETARAVSPFSFRSWRIKDLVTTNPDGHAISYELLADPANLFHGPSYEPFTQNELYVTVNKTCEKYVSHNPTTGGCGNNVAAFVNGESLSGADLVVWYGLSFHHLPRDEDQNYMPAHWSSFKIVPRDWSATNTLVGFSTPTPGAPTATFTPVGPTNTPTATNTPAPTATATNTPAPGQELVVNGGFEGSVSPWTLSGHATRTTGATPHGGAAYLMLANVNNAKGAAYQQITVPSGAAPTLSFWLNVTSSETTPSQSNDTLVVEIRNTAGTLLQTLVTYSNLDRGTAGVYIQRGGFNLSAYAGQTIRVQFRTSSNGSLITSFLVDDVSVR